MPKPIIVNLGGAKGYQLRQKAAEYVSANQNRTGAERGSAVEQGFGALAEIVIRANLGLPEINPDDHPVGYDLILRSGIKVDVKCRGGKRPFEEAYDSDDGVPREAKHNFFARQVHGKNLDADIYVMTHLRTPSVRTLPGKPKQRNWMLYVCGWVSKERALREGVYLPRGSLTEQGRSWFTYRGQEVEFYHHNLNALTTIETLHEITPGLVEQDRRRIGDLNLTKADAVRIGRDLVGMGILTQNHLKELQSSIGVDKPIKPILHPNQYIHLLEWLAKRGTITCEQIEKARETLKQEHFTGI